ncbi:MAG: hypothetical protein K8F29_11980 [Kofleriaceae bacterium]|nr:hypothetical protein [Candidatus Methylomirabilis lanthanidiphila]
MRNALWSFQIPQGLILVSDTRFVERDLHVKDGLLGLFEHRVETVQDRHR